MIYIDLNVYTCGAPKQNVDKILYEVVFSFAHSTAVP